ncbi:MAG: hypothetical protein AAF560_26185 [Acidobacteriota bacterium]
MKAALFLSALWLAACSPPEVNIDAERASTEACRAKLDAAILDVASKNRTLERLQSEVEQLIAENNELKEKLETAEILGNTDSFEALRHARAEAQRYREGLERAVAKLNELNTAAGRPPISSESSTP